MLSLTLTLTLSLTVNLRTCYQSSNNLHVEAYITLKRLVGSVVRYPRYVDTYRRYLREIPVSPRSRYTAVYRSSTKYRKTAQVSRVSSIPYSSYHLAFSNVHITSL